MSLNLSGTNQGEPCKRTLCCATPQQPTIFSASWYPYRPIQAKQFFLIEQRKKMPLFLGKLSCTSSIKVLSNRCLLLLSRPTNLFKTNRPSQARSFFVEYSSKVLNCCKKLPFSNFDK